MYLPNHTSTSTDKLQKEILRRTVCRLKWQLTAMERLLATAFLCLSLLVYTASCNRAPVFLIDDHAEIVIRLKEYPDTPVGTLIYKLRGYDADGDPLTFGVQKSADSNIIRLKQNTSSEAYVYLNHELDRETKEEYTLILTLSDGRLGEGNFVTQSFLLLVEDINDNEPIFKPFASVLEVAEDSPPGILTTLEATDRDEGAYGQVIYLLQGLSEENNMFSVATVNGKGVVRLARSLDYERQHFYHINVLAVDRAIQGRINTGTAALLVRVKDVEDQPPEFLVTQPVVRIAEDAPIGSEVMRVKAVDGDRGINNRILYDISNNASELFEVDRLKGSVRTRQKLDREDSGNPINGAFILEIVATEESKLKPRPSATMEITVIVTDVNDEIPRFRSSGPYECEISENAQQNTLATFLEGSLNEVFDYDQGTNGTFLLSLQPPSDIFEVIPKRAINEATFGIRVKNPALLDYERLREINLTIVASEIDMPARRSVAPVRVKVLDQNDNFPEFGRPIYEIDVPENVTTGTVLVQISATDVDSGSYGTRGIRYTNLTGSISSSLLLDPRTGIITVSTIEHQLFDREIIQKHYLTVEAQDNGGRGNRNTVQLILNLLDVNDNAPVFLQKRYEVRLKENAFEFESPITIEARDNDLEGSANSAVEYRLLETHHSEHFHVGLKSGRLSVREAVDFEQLEGSTTDTRAISLTVETSDGGEPRLSAQVEVTVYVQDVNDYAPEFLEAQYAIEIPEDTMSGFPVLKVIAMDGDGSYPNNLVSYRIQQGAEGKFVIGAETGEISVTSGASLDPDLIGPDSMGTGGSSYLLEVIASDGGNGGQQLQGSCLVNVTVTDVNNKSPVFVGPTAISVKENTPVGTEVYRLMANDPDESAMLRYYIDRSQSEGKTEEGVPVKLDDYDFAAAFVLDANNGLLKISKLLDREKISEIKLVCMVEDVAAERGDQIASTVLKITILDENDNNPKFRKPFYKYSIAENTQYGVPVCTVVAEDADLNKTIKYSLEGDKSVLELLHIDDQTGEIVVRNRIDHEEFGWLNFSVRAMDFGSPPRASFVEVFVQVLDENDNNPYFVDGVSDFYVAEGAPVGTEIAVITAKDLDSGDFGRITYILDRVSSKEKFSIDPEKGILRVAGSLDREETDQYMMAVEAWDNYPYGYLNGESRNAFKHILVHVTDDNDNAPIIQKPTGCSMITEYHNINEPIVKLRATDADDPTTGNGQISFDINDASGIFYIQQISPQSAEIYARGPLKNLYGNYTLDVIASDQGSTPNTVKDSVQICVADFNDHPPVFVVPSGNTTVKVFENTTVGKPFFQVHAYDEDVGENAIVRYRFKMDTTGNYKKFSIDKETGEISVASPLDREKQMIYDLRVEAYDQGVPTPLSSSVDLIVYVRDVNDNQPQFLLREISLNFTEHTIPSAERIRLPDTVEQDYLDPVEGTSTTTTTVCYYIVAGNEDGHFQLDPISHELMVSRELDREVKSRYKLQIKATEDCSSSGNISAEPTGHGANLLKVSIYVNDINDNSPVFESKIFTGGISTSYQFGASILQLKAHDDDDGLNGLVRYYRHSEIRKTLAEGLDELRSDPFLVDADTGQVLLNFFPQKSMRGYFDFSVTANDSFGCADRAHVFIYLIREDQRVKFILRQRPSEIRDNINSFREILSNVSGCIVNIDDIRLHENPDGSVDRTKSDMFMHLVDQKNNSVLEVHEVLQLLDKHVEKLDRLFKEFNVLDTQASQLIQTPEMDELSVNIIWLFVTNLVLGSLLIVVIGLSVSQRLSYRRRLRAAKIAAYGTSGPSRAYQEVLGAVPNTNKHSMKGSNPIWISDGGVGGAGDIGEGAEWLKDEFDKCKDAIDAQYERSLSSGFFIDNCLQYEVSRKVGTTGDSGHVATTAGSNYQIKQMNETAVYARNLETTEL